MQFIIYGAPNEQTQIIEDILLFENIINSFNMLNHSAKDLFK